MYVIMAKRIGGYRDGIEWPAPGEGIELPDHEAADMIRNGYCRPADDEPAAVEDTGPEQPPLADEHVQALALLLADAGDDERALLLDELDDTNRAAVEAALNPGGADAHTTAPGDENPAATTDPAADPDSHSAGPDAQSDEPAAVEDTGPETPAGQVSAPAKKAPARRGRARS